jgi:uncharacterized membrane protein YphA (DoxX/SURF4 family)
MENIVRVGAPTVFLSRLPYQFIRWFLAVIFLHSGVSKLFDPKAFAAIIEAYGLIPDVWAMPVAVALPLIESITAIGLICDIRGSLEVITGLLILFMLILGYGIHMGLDIDCGCFGIDDPEHRGFSSLRPALYRDIVMLLGIIYLYGWRYWQKYKQH